MDIVTLEKAQALASIIESLQSRIKALEKGWVGQEFNSCYLGLSTTRTGYLEDAVKISYDNTEKHLNKELLDVIHAKLVEQLAELVAEFEAL